MPSTLATAFKPAAVLVVSGDDAFSFLQGQLSNDLKPRGAGRATYGLWLSAKGKVDGDAFVIEREDGRILLVSPCCPAAALQERLEAFIIADDVVLEDVASRWSGLAVWGPGAADAAAHLGATAPHGRHAHIAPGLVGFASHRWGEGTVEWLFESGSEDVDSARAKLEAAGVAFVDEATAELERILRGGVAVPAELGPGDLPQEAGVESFAVSFNKGCYIGQEVMARLHSMGRVRRGLVRVRGDGALPALPAALHSGARRIGELRSATPLAGGGFVGRAMVSLTDLPSEFAIGEPGSAEPQVVRIDP